MNRLTTNKGWRIPLLLAGVAAAVQVAFLLSTRHALFFRYPLVDAATYYQQALAIAAGHGTPGAFWQPPGYPHVLAAWRVIAGADPFVLRSVQALLLAPPIAVLTWLVARRLLPGAWATAAGCAVSLTGPLLFHQSQLLPAAPATALVLLTLLTTLQAMERPSLWRWLRAGTFTGLATLFVATCGALLPVQIVLAARAASVRSIARRAACALAVAAGLLVVLLPVAIRNREACGHWVWLSANSGTNFYVGNARSWEVTLTTQPGQDWDTLMRLPMVQGGARDAVEADRYFGRLARQEIARDAGGWLHRLFLKTAMFWHGREIPRNIDIYGWREQSPLLAALVWRAGICFPSGLLVPLAAVGALALRRRPSAVLLTASALAFGLLVAWFFPCGRYRVPMLPAIAILACAGLQALCAAARARRTRALSGLAAVALVLAAAANWPVRWPTDRIRYDAHLWNAIGAAADVRQDLATARACYEKAIQRDPKFADAQFNLGTVYGRQRDRARSQACYEAAIASRPDHDKAHVNLALWLAESGHLDAALHHLTLAEGLNPLNAEAYSNHGVLLLRAGRRDEALAKLALAAALNPAHQTAYRAAQQQRDAPASKP